jgi:hypothetical protein
VINEVEIMRKTQSVEHFPSHLTQQLLEVNEVVTGKHRRRACFAMDPTGPANVRDVLDAKIASDA